MAIEARRHRLLLVDDDESLRTVIQKFLEKLGYEVHVAANGKTALELFMRGSFDVVISDIRMPELDGKALTKSIRAVGKTPIVLMTGFSDIVEAKDAHALGANEFLAKPFDRVELQAAIERCLTNKTDEGVQTQYCRLAIGDFLSGKGILFGIYLRLGEGKFIKVAHRGEDLSVARIATYQSKGVHFLYLRNEDFRKYVGFSLKVNKAAGTGGLNNEKRLHLARHTGEILFTQIGTHGVDPSLYSESSAFVETVVEVLSEDDGMMLLLDSLRAHGDFVYAHAVGVSFYGALMAKQTGWNLTSNRFKVALGGLLHDVGEKEVPAEILSKPRQGWSVQDVQLYETHPLRGVELLNGIQELPDDILQVVKQHYESGLSRGFPARLKSHQIHPMAKLIAVADLFCELVIVPPGAIPLTPGQAIEKMSAMYSDRLDGAYFKVLKQLFQPAPAAAGNV